MLVIFLTPGVRRFAIQVHDPSLSSLSEADNYICDPPHRPMFLFFLAVFDLLILFLT